MEPERELERYLHRQIPLSQAMAVAVQSATLDSVVLAAPLAPNINHKHTAFGGSVSALGILAAWSLVHLRLTAAGLRCEVVIQANQMEYDKPIDGAFTAASTLPDAAAAWPNFVKILTRKRRARIEVHSALAQDGKVAGRLTGKFVAFLQEEALA